MSFAIEYIESGSEMEVEDFSKTFSDGFVMSTRYSDDGDVDLLPRTTNFVFEILRMEFRGMSTRPRESSTAFEVWRSTSNSVSVACFVDVATIWVAFKMV